MMKESAEHDGSIAQIPHFVILLAIQRQVVSDIHEHLSKQMLTTPVGLIAPPVIMISVVSIMPAKPDTPDSVERRTLNQSSISCAEENVSKMLIRGILALACIQHDVTANTLAVQIIIITDNPATQTLIPYRIHPNRKLKQSRSYRISHRIIIAFIHMKYCSEHVK